MERELESAGPEYGRANNGRAAYGNRDEKINSKCGAVRGGLGFERKVS